MDSLFLSLIAVFIVSLASLIGVTTLVLKIEYLDILVHYLIAFATGALLAAVFFELLPEAVELTGGEFSPIIGFIIIGAMAGSFIVERTIRWHSHHSLVEPTTHHSPLHPPHNDEPSERMKPYVLNILIGDSIHNFVDGLALVAAFSVGFEVGLVVFFGILIHELAQEFGDFGILVHGGLSPKKALMANFLSSIPAIIGVFFGVILLSNETIVDIMTLVIISISAGLFLYIATADLIPELTEELSTWKSFAHTIVGAGGVILIYMITLLEVH
ncbi:MAG: ZIP family metal transporter [Candidatus Hodarchaeales archaeon]|jgi:zinc and cadmium transporter